MPTPASLADTRMRHVIAQLFFTSSVALLGSLFILSLSQDSEGACQRESDYAAHAAALTARTSTSDCSAPDADWPSRKRVLEERDHEIPIRILKATRDAILNGLADGHSPCRLVPAFENGRAYGFKIFGVREGSELRALGFENGDVVTRVGTYEFTSPEIMMEAYQKLRDATSFTLTVVRRGEERTRIVELEH
jgi:hypothetical protein